MPKVAQTFAGVENIDMTCLVVSSCLSMRGVLLLDCWSQCRLVNSLFMWSPVGLVSNSKSSGLHCENLGIIRWAQSGPPGPRPLLPMPSHFSVLSALRPSVGKQSSQSQVCFLVESTGLYFLRRTAVLILRPAIACCPAGEAVKDFVDLEEQNDVLVIINITTNITIRNRCHICTDIFQEHLEDGNEQNKPVWN